jgi:8-oxo-dGTP diphosphatase
VFAAEGLGMPRAADDAASLSIFPLHSIPEKLCFDHSKILADYARLKGAGFI